MKRRAMRMTRREALTVLAGAVPALHAAGGPAQVSLGPSIAAGPFTNTRESLAAYRVPEWFRDAKFGIWAHWGPQSSVEAGDWYARNMYIEGERQYRYHLEHYGHPSKVGYKDLIPAWKGEKFDPDYLVGLYKKAGAKYFMSMGVHHDNFDMWNSKHQRWNAANMGIKRDVVGSFRQAAMKHGLKFGVSDHLWISYKWFAVSHLADKDGAYAGVPYDGANPAFADLYHEISDPKLLTAKLDWNEDGIPESWKQHWFLRISDLVDQYQPDLLYSDGQLPFGDRGLSLLANFYNANAKRNDGVVEAVYTSKRKEDSDAGMCVLDRERGVLDEISTNPWQTDTCIGDWHYNRDITYKTPKTIVDMLVDIVSKNGNLMLNFPLPSSGMLDDRELKILAEITDWMSVNGEAIYSTRPWRISGQSAAASAPTQDASFNESKRKALTTDDARFTTKGQTLYAFVMGWPAKEAVIAALGSSSANATGKVERVELLGSPGKLKWAQEATALKIELPEQKPCEHAVAFRISGTGLV
jgi:alpha-L-fucosidase